MVQVAIKPDYSGPTILELAPVINDVQDKVVQVKWENSRTELRVLEQFSKREFLLYVPNLGALERASTALGLVLIVEPATIENAKGALNIAARYNWRGFVKDIGTNLSRSLITKLAADSIRRGGKPQLALIASECLLDGINPIDADVLLRLRTL